MIPGKLGLHKLITSTGSLGEFDIDIDNCVRFYVNNAGPTFAITVRGRIVGQPTFTFIDTVVGNGIKEVDTSKWDFLEIEVTTYSSLSNFVDMSASGFMQAVGGAVNNVNVVNFPNPQNVAVTSFPVLNQFAPPKEADYIGTTYNLTTDIYVYKQGGSSGLLLKTITITYTDSTKDKIASVEVV
jgi:hypothetical protein